MMCEYVTDLRRIYIDDVRGPTSVGRWRFLRGGTKSVVEPVVLCRQPWKREVVCYSALRWLGKSTRPTHTHTNLRHCQFHIIINRNLQVSCEYDILHLVSASSRHFF
jgi:hypothetical protein